MEQIVTGVGVIDKAARLIGAIEERPRDLSELCASTQMPRATAHRLLVALQQHGFVRRDEQGRFMPGLRFVGLGRAAANALPLPESARPELAKLRDKTGESAQLYVREGNQRICVVSLESLHGLRTIVAPGASLPLDAGSAGHVLTAKPGQASQHRWVQSVGEREAGVASVSAPVCSPSGEVIAAVSISGPINRMGTNPGAIHGEAVVATAQAIEASAVSL